MPQTLPTSQFCVSHLGRFKHERAQRQENDALLVSSTRCAESLLLHAGLRSRIAVEALAAVPSGTARYELKNGFCKSHGKRTAKQRRQTRSPRCTRCTVCSRSRMVESRSCPRSWRVVWLAQDERRARSARRFSSEKTHKHLKLRHTLPLTLSGGLVSSAAFGGGWHWSAGSG